MHTNTGCKLEVEPVDADIASPRTIAFYLPQFHRIPENDRWWGDGFTEWTNVRRARPQFRGHQHPRVPGSLGSYDLTDPDVLRAQSQLARSYGLDAFCIYFYWFDGVRLLERPLEEWRKDESLLPYCLSWANENWTRRWDGKESEILMRQTYKDGYEAEIFRDLLPHFRAAHYVRVEGKPVLLVHRVDEIPDAHAFAARLRRLARAAGLPGIHLTAAETKYGLDPRQFGFDAVAEFPPAGVNTLGVAYLRPIKGVARGFRGRLMSYEKLMWRYRHRPTAPFTRYPSTLPGWDNTARRQDCATIYVGASTGLYSEWLWDARRREQEQRAGDGLVFINAWNEWAEGAYLEPDLHSGRGYLEATRELCNVTGTVKVQHGVWWSSGQWWSICRATAATCLSLARRVRFRVSIWALRSVGGSHD